MSEGNGRSFLVTIWGTVWRSDVTDSKWATWERVWEMCDVPSSVGGRRMGSEPWRRALGMVCVER